MNKHPETNIHKHPLSLDGPSSPEGGLFTPPETIFHEFPFPDVQDLHSFDLSCLALRYHKLVAIRHSSNGNQRTLAHQADTLFLQNLSIQWLQNQIDTPDSPIYQLHQTIVAASYESPWITLHQLKQLPHQLVDQIQSDPEAIAKTELAEYVKTQLNCEYDRILGIVLKTPEGQQLLAAHQGLAQTDPAQARQLFARDLHQFTNNAITVSDLCADITRILDAASHQPLTEPDTLSRLKQLHTASLQFLSTHSPLTPNQHLHQLRQQISRIEKHPHVWDTTWKDSGRTLYTLKSADKVSDADVLESARCNFVSSRNAFNELPTPEHASQCLEKHRLLSAIITRLIEEYHLDITSKSNLGDLFVMLSHLQSDTYTPNAYDHLAASLRQLILHAIKPTFHSHPTELAHKLAKFTREVNNSPFLHHTKKQLTNIALTQINQIATLFQGLHQQNHQLRLLENRIPILAPDIDCPDDQLPSLRHNNLYRNLAQLSQDFSSIHQLLTVPLGETPIVPLKKYDLTWMTLSNNLLFFIHHLDQFNSYYPHRRYQPQRHYANTHKQDAISTIRNLNRLGLTNIAHLLAQFIQLHRLQLLSDLAFTPISSGGFPLSHLLDLAFRL